MVTGVPYPDVSTKSVPLDQMSDSLVRSKGGLEAYVVNQYLNLIGKSIGHTDSFFRNLRHPIPELSEERKKNFINSKEFLRGQKLFEGYFEKYGTYMVKSPHFSWGLYYIHEIFRNPYYVFIKRKNINAILNSFIHFRGDNRDLVVSKKIIDQYLLGLDIVSKFLPHHLVVFEDLVSKEESFNTVKNLYKYIGVTCSDEKILEICETIKKEVNE